MIDRLANPTVAPVAKHLAFATIGAAIIAEALVAAAFVASGDTTASLLTAEPVYRLHFAMVATYYSLADFAGQLLSGLDLSTLEQSALAFASDKLSAVPVQLDSNQLSFILIGR
jgi:hypothetical protein